MRKLAFLLLILPLVALGITACDGSGNPAGPAGADQASLAGNQAATAGPLSAARHGPKMVPYKGDVSFGPASPVLTVCDNSGGTVALARDNVGVGQHSHMGRTSSSITILYCEVTASGAVLGGGPFTHVAANGDAVTGLWDALFTPTTFAFVANEKIHPIVFTGGTGRFTGASGNAYGGGTIDAVTGLGTFSVQGVLSSVGSLK